MCRFRAAAVGLALLGCVALLSASPPARAEETGPERASTLALHLRGDPPPGGLRIRLNDAPLAEIATEVRPRIEIADRLVEGVNRLELELLPATEQAVQGRDLEVIVARPGSGERDALVFPIVRSIVAAGSRPEGCKETIAFWVGPRPAAAKPPMYSHWLVARGPASGHRVSVLINDRPAYSVTSGDAYADVTEHVVAGRNHIEFRVAPSCLAGSPRPAEPLRVSLMLGWREMDRVSVAGAPLAWVEVRPDEPPEPFERSKSFRAK